MSNKEHSESGGRGYAARILRLLPSPVSRWIRRRYYLRVVRSFTADRWPGAEIVRRLVQPGDHVFDVGANVGYVTRLLAEWVGPTGSVTSFEPVPETFDVLSRTIRSLGLHQVDPQCCALSNREGEACMEVPVLADGRENIYESHLLPSGQVADKGRTAKVRVSTLDAYAASAEAPITFVKVDVEGHELDTIGGGCRMLGRFKPALYIEVAGNPDEGGSTAAHLFSLLAGLGYAPFVLDGKDVRARIKGDKSVDYFFLTPAHQGRLAG